MGFHRIPQDSIGKYLKKHENIGKHERNTFEYKTMDYGRIFTPNEIRTLDPIIIFSAAQIFEFSPILLS